MTAPARYRFGVFLLDAGNRSLLHHGEPVALNARYFDALVLLVREHGRLVAKQQLFDQVWAGSVVTDAALTQCIKAIRRVLGDDAGDPRFVRTVTGHGYSFIAAVVVEAHGAGPGPALAAETPEPAVATRDHGHRAAVPATIAGARPGFAWTTALPGWLVEGTAATLGGGAAGLLGGLLYGSALAIAAPAQGLGSLSVLLVLLALSVLVGLVAALGVGFGLALGRQLGAGPAWALAGAAAGGLAVGGLGNLLGSDAFTLLIGKAPSGLAGGLEGAAIGLAVAIGVVLGGASDARSRWRPVAWVATCTGLAGALIALAGGSLMATSLARIALAFEHSRLDLTALGSAPGAPAFGLPVAVALGAIEGAIFGAGVAAGLAMAFRRVPRTVV